MLFFSRRSLTYLKGGKKNMWVKSPVERTVITPGCSSELTANLTSMNTAFFDWAIRTVHFQLTTLRRRGRLSRLKTPLQQLNFLLLSKGARISR